MILYVSPLSEEQHTLERRVILKDSSTALTDKRRGKKHTKNKKQTEEQKKGRKNWVSKNKEKVKSTHLGDHVHSIVRGSKNM